MISPVDSALAIAAAATAVGMVAAATAALPLLLLLLLLVWLLLSLLILLLLQPSFLISPGDSALAIAATAVGVVAAVIADSVAVATVIPDKSW